MSTNDYIGKVLGNYHITERVGGGAFGTVFRAEHNLLANRTVAIKIMHMAYLDAEADRDRFIKEARLLERLAHPHILPIIDVGHNDGFPYIVTTYAPNGSLRDRMHRIYPQRLSITETVRVLSQVGEAISFAHQHGVIHRDVKPANILFDEKGDALLADFGIATTLASASIKNINEMTGSAPYMAPEQFQGRISKECDQYALGCIAYEMFTSHQPFSAPDFVSMAFKHMTEMPPSPLQYNPDIPPYIEQAILKAIAKDRANRYPSVLAFIQALQPNVDMEQTMLASYRRAPNPLSSSQSGSIPTSQASASQTLLAPNSGADVTQRVETNGVPTQLPPIPVTPPLWVNERQTGAMAPFPQTANMSEPTMPLVGNPGGVAQLRVPGGIPSPSFEPPGANRRKRRSPLLLIALLAALVLVLIPAAVAAFYTFAYPATASVTLDPIYKDVKGAFTITAVAGKPDTTKNQVTGVRILSSTQSKQVPATATGTQPYGAQQATGQIAITNNYPTSITFNVGDTFTNPAGVIVVLTTSAVIAPAATATVSGYVSTPTGAASNLAAGAFNGQYCHNGDNCATGSEYVLSSAFTGGVDAGSSTTVQQSDIDNAANPLKGSLTQAAHQDLQSKVQSGEQAVGSPQCSSQVQSDQNAGAVANAFHVKVTVTCTELAYNSQAAQAMAATELKGQAQSSPGPHFILTGQIITTPGASRVVDGGKGIVAQDITAEGIWTYVFTSAEKQHLASFIEGKTVQDATNLLLSQNGVHNVHIDLSGAFLFWNKMPTNLDNISFVVGKAGVPVLGSPPSH